MRLGFDFLRHVRFYTALGCGVAAFAAARLAGSDAAALLGGDVFCLVFLVLCAIMVAHQTPADLKLRAKEEDEGIAIVVLIILGTILFFVVAAFEALNRKQGVETSLLVLAGIGAPLGWFVFHTAMAFHYADIHYFDDPECDDDYRDLDFPGRAAPGPWEFLYFSFVIGMTCQVSDVQVKTSVMRRNVLWHGVVSFFFNTVFIAMAVNAAVAMAAT
jgi:uncharacterized membrane protein